MTKMSKRNIRLMREYARAGFITFMLNPDKYLNIVRALLSLRYYIENPSPQMKSKLLKIAGI